MAKKINMSADQLAQRWKTGLQNASTKIEQGVNSVQTSPGQMAAQQADLWLKNVTAAKDKWKNRVGAVKLEDWRRATIEKGIPNLQNSLDMGSQKVMASAQRLIPIINDLMQSLPPKGTTLEQNLLRVRHMAQGLQNAYLKG